MSRETIIVATCDLCGERRAEKDLHMDLGWTWDGKDYLFDADEDCFGTVEVMSVTELLSHSRLDTRQPAAKLTGRSGRAAQRGTAPNRNGRRPKRGKYSAEEYAKQYRTGRTWRCPACQYSSSAERYLLLANHYRHVHNQPLWQHLEVRIANELLGPKRTLTGKN